MAPRRQDELHALHHRAAEAPGLAKRAQRQHLQRGLEQEGRLQDILRRTRAHVQCHIWAIWAM